MPSPKKRFQLERNTLKRNLVDPDVSKLQKYLGRFGYLTAKPKAGKLDGKTSTAVKRFQRQMGLPQTGEVNAATRKALEAYRCANIDAAADSSAAAVAAGYKLSGCKYNKTTLTYRFGTGTGDIPGTNERAAIQNALRTWTKACGLKFRRVTSNPDLIFNWATGSHGDGEPFDGSGNVLAHAFYPPNCGGTHAGKCHFDDAEGWTLDGTDFDTETVALHEIGHLLGLKHSTKSSAVMYANYGGQRRQLTQDDISGGTKLYRGNVHIQGMNTNGTVGMRAGTHTWTNGWTSAVPYKVGTKSFLFLLKEKGTGSDGKNVHVHRLDADGDVGARVASYKWTEGWTTVSFYKIGSTTYLFLLKKSGLSSGNKNVHIHRMNANGSVGTRIKTYKWSSGWTQAVPYKVGSRNFLFLLKKSGLSGSNKNVHIHKLNNNGTVGARVTDYKWSKGWTTAFFYQASSKTYLFLLKKTGLSGSNKNVHMHRMKANGSVGSRTASYKWTSGWSSAVPYKVGSQNYLFLLKATGTGSDGKNVHIQKLNASGTVGARVKSYKWTRGWTSVSFYKLGSKLFLFLLKKVRTD